jgi:GntR family transcriptional regulator, transcriptional repressor for pyruvate dehydrogenase complex
VINKAVRTNHLFKPLQEKRTFKEIANQIRLLINSRALKPGEKLPSENELAVQFKTGRLSVREALRMLEQAGLIEVRQGSTGGSFVKELDSTVAVESFIDLMWQGDLSIENLTDARSSIETLILTKVFSSFNEQTLQSLEVSVQELENLIIMGKESRYPVDPTLTDFHLLLARLTDNPIFPIILKVLLEMTKRVMQPATVSLVRLREHAVSHRAILDALKAGDLKATLRAMEEHLIAVSNRQIADKDSSVIRPVRITPRSKNNSYIGKNPRMRRKGR